MYKGFSTLVVALLFSTPAALAQTAGMLSFQGLVKDSGGNPVAGPVTLEFRIFNAASGGSLVAGPFGPTALTASSGVVATKFGPVPPSAFDGSPRFLEVSELDGKKSSTLPHRFLRGFSPTFVTLSLSCFPACPASSLKVRSMAQTASRIRASMTRT